MQYKVKAPLTAVIPEQTGGFRFVTVEAGSLIRIHGTVQKSGLVDVLCDGTVLAAFMRDLQERAELVHETSV